MTCVNKIPWGMRYTMPLRRFANRHLQYPKYRGQISIVAHVLHECWEDTPNAQQLTPECFVVVTDYPRYLALIDFFGKAIPPVGTAVSLEVAMFRETSPFNSSIDIKERFHPKNETFGGKVTAVRIGLNGFPVITVSLYEAVTAMGNFREEVYRKPNSLESHFLDSGVWELLPHI